MGKLFIWFNRHSTIQKSRPWPKLLRENNFNGNFVGILSTLSCHSMACCCRGEDLCWLRSHLRMGAPIWNRGEREGRDCLAQATIQLRSQRPEPEPRHRGQERRWTLGTWPQPERPGRDVTILGRNIFGSIKELKESQWLLIWLLRTCLELSIYIFMAQVSLF